MDERFPVGKALRVLARRLSLACAVLLVSTGRVPPAAAGTVTYDFAGGSMSPTATGLPAGVTASEFSTGDAADLADPDDDGRPNLMECAFGAAPTAAGGWPVYGSTVARGSKGFIRLEIMKP